MRGCAAGLGEGFWDCGDCAWATASEVANTSNNPARDVLFIGNTGLLLKLAGADKFRLDSPMPVSVVNRFLPGGWIEFYQAQRGSSPTVRKGALAYARATAPG